MVNPSIPSSEALSSSTTEELLAYIYQLLLASVSLFFALILLFGLFKIVVWVLPNFWYRERPQ